VNVDVAVIGAGPTGLCLARALSQEGLSVLLVEQQDRSVLADPPFDGREIALSHPSRHILERLGIWPRFPQEDVSPLRDALVLDGTRARSMHIHARDAGHDVLGHLVANHVIRRHAYEAAMESPQVTLLDNARVKTIRHAPDHVALDLGEQTVRARLLVAADSRFSETRRVLGIPTHMHDFGKAMMVCRFEHELPHEHIAVEWFGYGQTLALLPLNDNRVSVILTLPQQTHKTLMAMDETVFAAHVQERMQHRLGGMRQISTRHVYPLVGVYAHRFFGPRFALVGDAAVGMHPVTAHGFNFGLQGGDRLATQVLHAARKGQDIGAAPVLQAYDRSHRRGTLPLYMATFVVANLFTSDHQPLRLLRRAALSLADKALPFKRTIIGHLTQAG